MKLSSRACLFFAGLFDTSARMSLLTVQKNARYFFCASAIGADFTRFVDINKPFVFRLQNLFHDAHCVFHADPLF